MTDAEETLVGFVTAQYNKLKKELNLEMDSNEDVKAVIAQIDELFETFKNPDSKHDAIVEQLVELQAAYNSLGLAAGDYPRYATASDNLKTIMAALKEEEVGEEEEEEEE